MPLLVAADLLDEQHQPLQDAVRHFLEAPRGEALAILFRGWLRSATFNELFIMPEVSVEGEWKNDPILARRAILDFLSTVPGALPGDEKPFWSLAAFINSIRQTYPDFQRPSGDYDSWYLRSRQTGLFLRGFDHWEAVDGALVRFVLTGPLHWLGVLDLALTGDPKVEAATTVGAFRYTEWASDLLNHQSPQALPAETEKVQVAMDGKIRVPLRAPRPVRYQVARYCEWISLEQGVYTYRISPTILTRARKQGLRVGPFLSMLRKHAQSVPPNIVRALESWEEQGVQASLERVTVLRLGSPELLQSLRSSRAARYLGDPLGPAAVLIRPGAEDKVLSVLLELGLLGAFEQS